mgnify:CR=1 FL=1
MDKQNTMTDAIAARLRIAREQAGLSQGQVAKMLGLHRPSVTEIEMGRRRVTAEELTTMSKLYGVSLSWLTSGESEAPDLARDRIELAARKLTKLKKEDLDRVLEFLKALHTRTDEEDE